MHRVPPRRYPHVGDRVQGGAVREDQCRFGQHPDFHVTLLKQQRVEGGKRVAFTHLHLAAERQPERHVRGQDDGVVQWYPKLLFGVRAFDFHVQHGVARHRAAGEESSGFARHGRFEVHESERIRQVGDGPGLGPVKLTEGRNLEDEPVLHPDPVWYGIHRAGRKPDLGSRQGDGVEVGPWRDVTNRIVELGARRSGEFPDPHPAQRADPCQKYQAG